MSDLEHEIDEPEVEEAEVETSEAPERDFEAEARDMGWKPKDEWDGRGTWRDAEEFVKRGEELLPIVQARLAKTRSELEAERKAFDRKVEERVRRLEAANKAAFDAQRRQYEDRIKAIEARQRQAAEDGDLATYDALTRQRQDMRPPEEPRVEEPKTEDANPAVQEWTQRNAWFNTDPVMRAVAVAAADTAGPDVAAQLAAAEAEVRRRFPEKFGNGTRATVETGGRPPARKREKGLADLPQEARDAFKRFVADGIYKQEDGPRYAKAYFEQG